MLLCSVAANVDRLNMAEERLCLPLAVAHLLTCNKSAALMSPYFHLNSKLSSALPLNSAE